MTVRWKAITALALACAVALVVALVVQSRTASHRADSALDGLRSLPGVSSADARNYPESSDERKAVVTMSESVTSKQVTEALAEARKAAAGDAISEVSLRVGAAHTVVTDRRDPLTNVASLLSALAGLPHGSAVVSEEDQDNSYQVTVDPDGRQPVDVARTALGLVRQDGARLTELAVGGLSTRAVVVVRGDAAPAARVLTALGPYRENLRLVRVGKTSVHITAGSDVSTLDIHRTVAPVVRKVLPEASLNIGAARRDAVQIRGTGATTAITETARQLKSHKLRLTEFGTDRQDIKVAGAKKSLTAKDLPAVERALTTLDPALSADCDIRVQRTAGGVDQVFVGSSADLSRVAPKAAAAAAKGYDVSWDGEFKVEIRLPHGTALTTKTAKPAMSVLRSLGWDGTVWVQISESVDEGTGDEVRFRSTATGTADVNNDRSENTEAFARAWNATATSDDGATS